MENVLKGRQVDVERFPAPRWHLEDGGRYIGTGSYEITRDLEEGWVNLGTYRVMVEGKDQVGFFHFPGPFTASCTARSTSPGASRAPWPWCWAATPC